MDFDYGGGRRRGNACSLIIYYITILLYILYKLYIIYVIDEIVIYHYRHSNIGNNMDVYYVDYKRFPAISASSFS